MVKNLPHDIGHISAVRNTDIFSGRVNGLAHSELKNDVRMVAPSDHKIKD